MRVTAHPLWSFKNLNQSSIPPPPRGSLPFSIPFIGGNEIQSPLLVFVLVLSPYPAPSIRLLCFFPTQAWSHLPALERAVPCTFGPSGRPSLRVLAKEQHLADISPLTGSLLLPISGLSIPLPHSPTPVPGTQQALSKCVMCEAVKKWQFHNIKWNKKVANHLREVEKEWIIPPLQMLTNILKHVLISRTSTQV